jgi:4-amino-4-deoxy-L-arabinose transferase-like glycosyltransferase
MGYLSIVSLFAALLKRRRPVVETTPKYVWLCALISLCCAIAIPVAYRLSPTRTAILPWECETILYHFDARQSNQSVSEFALSAIKNNQGLLSTSAKSFLFGIPTYAIFQSWGWNTTSLRLMAFIFGLGSLLLSFAIIRDLFNTTTALLFVILLSTNPLMLNYMGYGVSQTATLFGCLAGLWSTLKAIRYARNAQLAWAAAAGVLLFLATLNYAPGRIFVIATLGFLLLYCLLLWRWTESTTRSRVCAVIIMLVAGGLFWAQRELNSWSDLTTVRGEQVFMMSKHTDQLALYLGQDSTEEIMKSGKLSFSLMIRFCLAVAWQRFQEFYALFSPFRNFPTHWLRGSQHAEGFSPYASALILPITIGFLTCLRHLFSIRSFLLLTLFVGGLLPLLFTSRVDNHRSFLLLVPITAWGSGGISILIERLRGRALAEAHCALICVGVTACLIANTWNHLGATDQVDPNVSLMLSELDNQLQTQASVVSAGLNCSTQAAVDLRAAENARTATERTPVLWGRDIADKIIDGRFNSDSKELKQIATSAQQNPIITVSALPVTSWASWLRDSNLQVTESAPGNFRVVVAKTRD